MSRKFLYHFAIFALIDKILIIKNCRILVFNNFFLKFYQLNRKNVRDRNYLFSPRRTLRIFSEFFINFLVLHFFFIYTEWNLKTYGKMVYINIQYKEGHRIMEIIILWMYALGTFRAFQGGLRFLKWNILLSISVSISWCRETS